jgi:hypothetical protein
VVLFDLGFSYDGYLICWHFVSFIVYYFEKINIKIVEHKKSNFNLPKKSVFGSAFLHALLKKLNQKLNQRKLLYPNSFGKSSFFIVPF